jgi:hypothetical protein
MKIQILGNARTGTTSVYYSLLYSHHYSTGFYEPLNPDEEFGIINHKDPFSNPNKIKLQKHLSTINSLSAINESKFLTIEKNTLYVPLDFTNQTDIARIIDNQFDFYKSYFQNFDKLIFLYRKDVVATCKSLATAFEYKTWHTPYAEIPSIPYEQYLKYIIIGNELMQKLSDYFNIPLIYHEDLFYGDSQHRDNLLKYANLNPDVSSKFYNALSPSHKLMQPIRNIL